MSSLGEASFWDVAIEVALHLGWEDLLDIQKISSQEFAKNEPGMRPLKAIIVNKRLNSEKLNIQRTWQSALEDYLADPYFHQFRISGKTA